MSLTPKMMTREAMLEIIEELEASVERLKGALKRVEQLSRLRITEREDAIHQTARSALEAKP